MKIRLAPRISLAALISACTLAAPASRCCASAIQSWQGASASVQASGKQANDAGATASASSWGSYLAWSASADGQARDVGITSGGSATASGNAQNLLSASTSAVLGGEGVLVSPITPEYPVGATASWNNDSLTVRAPAGASLPDSVQLQFKVDATPDVNNQTLNPNIQWVWINGQRHALSDYYAGDKTIRLQPPQYSVGNGPNSSHQTGTFNIKLAIHPDGVSDPFSLAVSSGQPLVYISQYITSFENSISLSLTGVTLPDGTPLAAASYGVSFASGMALPEQPVPEPATLVLWGLCTLGALFVRRWRWAAA